MCDPLVSCVKVVLQARLEQMVGRAPVLKEKYRIRIRRQAVAEYGLTLNRTATIEYLFGDDIGDGLKHNLIVEGQQRQWSQKPRRFRHEDPDRACRLPATLQLLAQQYQVGAATRLISGIEVPEHALVLEISSCRDPQPSEF